MGIDRPPQGMKVPDYVLGKFSEEEMNEMKAVINKCTDACEEWLNIPFLQVMNVYNQS